MLAVKNPHSNAGVVRDTGSIPGLGRSGGGNGMNLEPVIHTPVFLPRESHGQSSLAGYSPWGFIGSDITKVTEHST